MLGDQETASSGVEQVFVDERLQIGWRLPRGDAAEREHSSLRDVQGVGLASGLSFLTSLGNFSPHPDQRCRSSGEP